VGIRSCSYIPNSFGKLKELKLITGFCYFKFLVLTMSSSIFCSPFIPHGETKWKQLLETVDKLPKTIVYIHFEGRMKTASDADAETCNATEVKFPLV